MKILNFGSCNVDYVYKVQSIVKVGETVSADSLGVFPGGKGLNQSIALSRAGVKVFHAGIVGEDGEFLKKVLTDSGVNTDFIKMVDGKSGHAIIQLDSEGENSIVVFKGTNGMVDHAFVDSVLKNFDEGDAILLQNEISSIDYILDVAYKKGMITILNPSPLTKKIKAVDLNKLSYLVLNRTEAIEFFGSDNPQVVYDYVKERSPKLKVVMTVGANGSFYLDEKEKLYCPAFKVDVVDTTAAGDTFTGYLVAEIALGNTPYNALKTASSASALAVQKMGASSSIPTREEVLKAKKELLHYPLSTRKIDDVKSLVIKYIEENITSANILELSNVLGYSKVYVSALVKRALGQSFSTLLQTSRVKLASKMLKETELSISEIISRVGYENESFFRKIFYKEYGKYPLDYRKQFNK